MKNKIIESTKSSDRYKIFYLSFENQNLNDLVSNLESENIKSINIGKELASFIDNIEDFRYLNIDVYDYLKKLLDKHLSKTNKNDVIAIYNLGILLEPALELNALKLFKEFSKSTALIILWENQTNITNRLEWATQKTTFFLDFSETQLKTIEYAI
jgi:hypothetical protein